MDGSLNLLMLEGLFIETVLITVLAITAYKFRRDFLAVKEKYKQLKSTISAGTTLGSDADDGNPEHGGNFFELLTQARDHSMVRFRQLSNTAAPRLSSNAPTMTNVAALRTLYLTAECEAFAKREDSKEQWKQLERGLKNLLQELNLADGETSGNKDQKIRLLRERLDSLKDTEKNLRQTQHQLEVAEQKIKRLEERNANMQEGLTRIRQINRSLNHINDQEHHNRWIKIEEMDAEKSLDFALENLHNAENSLSNIREVNRHKSQLTNKLLEDLDNSSSEHLKNKLKALQVSLEQSEAEIESLNREVAQLRLGVGQKREPSREAADVPITESQHFCDDIDVPTPTTELHKHQTLGQIHLLQDNNLQQRNMIVDLRREISSLQNEIQNNQDLSQQDVDEKSQQIEKLEALIRECDHCILALESEVEMLYNQLANFDDMNEDVNSSNSIDDKQEIERLHKELSQLTEMMNNTMTLYGDQSVLTKFAMDSANSHNVKDILIALDDAIRNMSVIPGINIRTRIGRCQLIPETHFNKADTEIIQNATPPSDGPVVNMNEKLLFWNKRLSFMVTNLPDDDERKIQIRDNLALLMNIADSEVQRLESNEISQRQKKTLEKLLGATQKELSNIDVQQSYQTNEFHLVLNKLLKEIYNISQSSDLPKTMRTLLNNVIRETQERSALLFASGSLVTDGFSQLIDSLNAKLSSEV